MLAPHFLGVAMLFPVMSNGLVLQAKHNRRPFRQEMDNIEDVQYHANMTVGSQVIQGILDTGSVELVVLSQKCHGCGEASQLYDGTRSRNHRAGSLRKTIKYGSGNVDCVEAYDNVTIGQYGHNPTAFWEVVRADMPVLRQSEFEAIVGLGPIPADMPKMSPGDSTNEYRKALMLDYLGLRQSKFSVCLGKTPGSPGYFVWNDDSVRLHRNSFKQLAVQGSGFYWMTKLTNLRLGETTLGCTPYCGAILDSGGSLISMHPYVVAKMETFLQMLGADCSTSLRGLPPLTFDLDGKAFSLPPDAYLGNVTGTASSEVEASMLTSSNIAGTSCKLAVWARGKNTSLGETIILGMPFFRSYYTTFAQRTETTPPEMFVAKASTDCKPSSDSMADNLGMESKMRQIDASKVRVSFSL